MYVRMAKQNSKCGLKVKCTQKDLLMISLLSASGRQTVQSAVYSFLGPGSHLSLQIRLPKSETPLRYIMNTDNRTVFHEGKVGEGISHMPTKIVIPPLSYMPIYSTS